MDELFDNPGDLGFFIQEDTPVEEEPLDNDFYEPFPGEGDKYDSDL